MSAEQIGGILFWTLFAAMILAFLGLFLGIRAMAKAGGGLVACAVAILFVSRLPTEIVGGILTWGLLALMYFGLFWALTRKR